ncbi:MAG: flagellar biosynthetic protein FliO [Bermanella sp.]
MMLFLLQAVSEAPASMVTPTLITPQIPNSEDQIIQVTLALSAILILIYAIAWFVKRYRGVQGLTGLPLKTLAVMPMGVKEKIVLIEVGGKQILLGLTAHNINTLATFDEPILQTEKAKSNNFSDRLKEIMSQNLKTKNESELKEKSSASIKVDDA